MERIYGTVDADLLRQSFDKYEKSHSMGEVAKKQKKRNLVSIVIEDALTEYTKQKGLFK